MKTQIKLLLDEESGQGLHCLQGVCIFLSHYSVVKPPIEFKSQGVKIFRMLNCC